MRSREAATLVRKELSELFAARAFWLVLLIAGVLTGQALIQAMSAYAEASGNGGPAALAQALSPLDGILTPTLGAFDLTITLLFPFVAIRLVASEKSSGALKLMRQWPVSMPWQLAMKVVALLVAWILSLTPFYLALTLWILHGGHLFAPEVANLLVGYTLRYLLTVSLSMAAAAVMPGAANAAIAVLGFTIGTWLLDFVATGRGGVVQRLASFTPTAALRSFERGLLRVDVILVMLVAAALAIAIAGIWLDLGTEIRSRLSRTAASILLAGAAAFGAAQTVISVDVSENRRNSFGVSESAMLAQIRGTLFITAYLAAEDPRMTDFENNVLVKLRRTVPDLRVRYPFAGRSALFENEAMYGQIVYQLGSHTLTSRSTTEEVVVETIAQLAGLPAPVHERRTYPGYPLAVRPAAAQVFFYGIWPGLVLVAWVAIGRGRRRPALPHD